MSFVKPTKAVSLIDEISASSKLVKNPVKTVISTWSHGMVANNSAWEVLSNNGRALDAVEKGVRTTESDMTNRSVGGGGRLPVSRPGG